MSKSNLDKAYLQPHKSITLIMQGATNEGMKPRVAGENWRPKNDLRFSPVVVQDGTAGTIAGTGRVALAVADKGLPIVGVTLESFSYTGVPTSVCVQGIVPMETATAIKAGDLIAPDCSATNTTGLVKSAQTGDWAFGIALTESKGTKGWVAVLLCKGNKVKAAV